MSKPIEFNVNDHVRVKLTDYGRELLRQQDEAFFAKTGVSLLPQHEDADGWSTWQLWTLMERLGAYCRLGGPEPFETTIWLCPPVQQAEEEPADDPESVAMMRAITRS